MKIIAISDLHGYLPQDIPECDLLLMGGDICPHFGRMRDLPGGPNDVSGQLSWMYSIFKDWLKKQPAVKIVATLGNHDFVGMHHDLHDLPWTLLIDEPTVVNGLYIYGSPWTPTFGHWGFMMDEIKLADKFAYIPDELDILLSHGPPLWCCDRMQRGDRVGSQALYNRLRIMDHPPKHVVCGHIHSARGYGQLHSVVDGTYPIEVWNVSSVDEAYIPFKPMWTEILLEDNGNIHSDEEAL